MNANKYRLNASQWECCCHESILNNTKNSGEAELDLATACPAFAGKDTKFHEKEKQPEGCFHSNHLISGLFHQLQFLDNIGSAAQFVNTPEHIADVDTDSAVQVFIKSQFVAQRFVVAVKCKAYQFAPVIDNR